MTHLCASIALNPNHVYYNSATTLERLYEVVEHDYCVIIISSTFCSPQYGYIGGYVKYVKGATYAVGEDGTGVFTLVQTASANWQTKFNKIKDSEGNTININIGELIALPTLDNNLGGYYAEHLVYYEGEWRQITQGGDGWKITQNY